MKKIGRWRIGTFVPLAFGVALLAPDGLANSGITVETANDYSFYCGDHSCDIACNSEGDGFWNSMTAGGTGWTGLVHYKDYNVWDTDFYDPNKSGNGNDNDTYNFDKSGNAISHATISQSGPVSDLLDPAPKLDWYSSVLSRSVGGIEVPDSFAFARFNADDEVVFESVYWPAIPAAAVADAVAFQQQLASPTNAAAFRAKLPLNLASQPGTIAIRHTRMTHKGSFVAKVSYDVTTPRPMNRVRHFDASATEFELPDTPAVAPETSKP
ncbi:MAG: hypothetical protein IPI67_30290 [Myxococcales bacterium]|nr:hypothetical protein [Myxococcales bacterium]